uniref:ER lumen protein-retaining receptor n=1 Tax=Eutreptiella gymnastica TaxID=73025 RepID=A0A7S1NIW0_9EUGL|mmetsp:Transcript_42510/g.76277  ORF Transcript_42510/g.76277 Transcript_42510/m.76277 type:complete len:215 (+) Transcript_42510:72-716(+)
MGSGLGDFLWLCFNGEVLRQMLVTRSCASLSLKSQVLYLIVTVVRYLDVFWLWNGVGTFVLKFMSILVCGHIVFLMHKRFGETYDRGNDTFKVRFLIGPSLALALVTSHFRIHTEIWHVCSKFSRFLQALAPFPQLFYMQRTGEARAITLPALVIQGLYHVVYVFHFVWQYVWGDMAPRLSFVLSHIMACFIFIDFAYNYLYKIHKDKLPTARA